MLFTELKDWAMTSQSLHQASMLLGPIHNALFAPRQNYLHLPMFIEPTGLVSQELPLGGVIHINFKEGAVIYQRGVMQATERFLLSQHTQISLFEALLGALKQDELATFFADVESDTLVEGLMHKLHADSTRTEFLHLQEVSHTDLLSLNLQTANEYATLLDGVLTATARFRARLGGHMTPIVVWPEHFDLSTLWFDPTNSQMEDSKPHINFGFSPYTTGQYEMPYLYAYAYPYPEGFVATELPSPMIWHEQGWRGIVIRYADMQGQSDPLQFIEASLATIYQVLSDVLDEQL
ncbi:MAG: DUF5996 family protein [Phototrophicaceae bacterium]